MSFAGAESRVNNDSHCVSFNFVLCQSDAEAKSEMNI